MPIKLSHIFSLTWKTHFFSHLYWVYAVCVHTHTLVLCYYYLFVCVCVWSNRFIWKYPVLFCSSWCSSIFYTCWSCDSHLHACPIHSQNISNFKRSSEHPWSAPLRIFISSCVCVEHSQVFANSVNQKLHKASLWNWWKVLSSWQSWYPSILQPVEWLFVVPVVRLRVKSWLEWLGCPAHSPHWEGNKLI